MAGAGYSDTPLIKKLGIKEEYKIWLINPPAGYFDLLEKNILSQVCPDNEQPDWVHLFADSRREFNKRMRQLGAVVKQNPRLVIWVSWYKKSSGIPTDLTEDRIRDYALQNGLVDTKVCAVSGQWSGLKLVVPLSKR